MFPTRIGFDGAGASGEELPEEVKGSGPVGGGEEVEINMDDEHGSLLDSLNVWREKVVVGEFPGIPRLSCLIELKMLDLLTFELDRGLVSHNMIVIGLQKRVNRVIQKGRKLLEASANLRKEKVKLEEKLQIWLLELQKVWERVLDLQEKVASA